MRPVRCHTFTLLLLLPSVSVHAQDGKHPSEKWERDIAAFEAKDAKSPPPKNAVLFVGSSSIRLWDLKKSFPELVTVNRGFGGSQIEDSIHFADRIIVPHKPKQIVLYAGDNDIAKGKSAERVVADYRKFVETVRKALPGVPIAFLPIKPSIKRWNLWPEMKKANEAIRRHAESDPGLAYIDTVTPMLDNAEGKPREEHFVKDGLHLSEEGYRLWTAALRKTLQRSATE